MYRVVSPMHGLCEHTFNSHDLALVSAYPSDPQAVMGLTKCMETLKNIEIVWPSAGRALELLRGSKVITGNADPRTLVNHFDRHKRHAEQPLDDSAGRPQLQNTSDYFPLRSHNYPAGYPVGHGTYQPGQPIQISTPPSNTPMNYLYHINNAPIANTLSTSVLPQSYSTGLVDEPIIMGHRVPNMNDPSIHNNQRFPQYWNDPSTYSQLGYAYNGMHEQPSAHHPSSHMFLPDQYNL